MASAAAVATDASKSPLPDNEINDELGTVGTITSADPPLSKRSTNAEDHEKREEEAERHDGDDDDDEDEDLKPASSRRRARAAAIFDDEDDYEEDKGDANSNKATTRIGDTNGDEDEEEDGGLFGSGEDSDEDVGKRQKRHLDDAVLDSGDDEDRQDRRIEDDEMEAEQIQEEVQISTMEADLARQPIPEPTDGELYLMRIPRFLTIHSQQFEPQHVFPSEPSAESNEKQPHARPKVSSLHSHNTAITTLLWRRSPTDPSQLQSNARIVRWSDGSLTLQFASDPTKQYPIVGNALAPSQPNPKKPTPVSNSESNRKVRANSSYNPDLDSFTYLTLGQNTTYVLRVTNKLTATLKVQGPTDVSGEALERLQNSLAVAGNVNGNAESSGMGVIKITEDPEKAKKRIEEAEKEKLKAQRRREAQEARDRERHGRVLGTRRGAGFGGGLTVGGLEDDDELGIGVNRTPGSANRKRKAPPPRGRRGEIYSDDEDGYGRRGRTKEDEYDEDDGFLVASDEEEQVSASSSDIDDGIVEPPRSSGRRQEQPAAAPQPQRRTTPQGELDAEGDLDDEDGPSQGFAASPSGRNKRRRVIEEDDDDDE